MTLVELIETYWKGLRDGRLLIQRCRCCAKYLHYPRPLCDRCHERNWEFVEVSGRGRLETWTTVCRVFDSSFQQAAPYTVCLVRLVEGNVGILGQIVDTGMERLQAGMLLDFMPHQAWSGHIVPGFIDPQLRQDADR